MSWLKPFSSAAIAGLALRFFATFLVPRHWRRRAMTTISFFCSPPDFFAIRAKLRLARRRLSPIKETVTRCLGRAR